MVQAIITNDKTWHGAEIKEIILKNFNREFQFYSASLTQRAPVIESSGLCAAMFASEVSRAQ